MPGIDQHCSGANYLCTVHYCKTSLPVEESRNTATRYKLVQQKIIKLMYTACSILVTILIGRTVWKFFWAFGYNCLSSKISLTNLCLKSRLRFLEKLLYHFTSLVPSNTHNKFVNLVYRWNIIMMEITCKLTHFINVCSRWWAVHHSLLSLVQNFLINAFSYRCPKYDTNVLIRIARVCCCFGWRVLGRERWITVHNRAINLILTDLSGPLSWYEE